jgi:NAD(P)-dependent dehydrogenase (short-subunit alcohol dehydrogenase family)
MTQVITERVKRKTIIVTGASQGIGAGVTKAFIKRGYSVVANSRKITESQFTRTDRLVLVDGNIGEAATAAKIAATAMSTFGSIDGVVNNAGIFFSKRFTDYTVHDFELLSETNLQGYIYITQLAVKQMLAQKTGGSITGITSAMVEHPIAGVNASVPMITKGAWRRSLAAWRWSTRKTASASTQSLPASSIHQCMQMPLASS